MRFLLKGRDRATNRPIGLTRLSKEDTGHWYDTNQWIYTDVEFADALVEYKTSARPKPREYCWRDMDSGDPCNNKIRPENARAGLWACGRHMARYQEEQARIEQRHESERREKALEEIAEVEIKEYEDAWQRLVDLGWQEYLPEKPRRRSWRGSRVENKEITMGLKVFLSLVDPEEEEQDDELDESDYATVEEDFFKSASDM
jgi:hypothetical protein